MDNIEYWDSRFVRSARTDTGCRGRGAATRHAGDNTNKLFINSTYVNTSNQHTAPLLQFAARAARAAARDRLTRRRRSLCIEYALSLTQKFSFFFPWSSVTASLSRI
ncbi:hypothetical protein EVAR_98325_1 [Eumeta japonica]|uniref:Uncharacterized protein n=1 Tax=Eumeta variegata TaxID=151549 RepID=A0A4C1X9D8_EUMVA|nr:hypothetical protein EVAR_98325_1 [Eumeta japonica]